MAMNENPETHESLRICCAANNRVVSLSPLPLILDAWHHTMPIEKQRQFKEQLKWAEAHRQLEEISHFLRPLSETQWCHFGEI
jgi:molybdopterin synthase catalytic subunit